MVSVVPLLLGKSPVSGAVILQAATGTAIPRASAAASISLEDEASLENEAMREITMRNGLIILLALALSACASFAPRDIAHQYESLSCADLRDAQLKRVDQRIETEVRMYGGPGPVEFVATVVTGVAAGEASSAAVAAWRPLVSLRESSVRARYVTLVAHIDLIGEIIKDRC